MFLFDLDYSNLSSLDIINIINFAFLTLLSLLTAYRFLYMIIGFFGVKHYEKTEERRSFGIVIAARNEAVTIGNLIKSIHQQDYPKELVKIFVVADNCIDNTAQIARDLGCVVYERFDDKLIGKGYALELLFNNIEVDYGIDHVDAYVLFDADNLLKEDYLLRINEAFVSGHKIITSFRNIKNFDSNLISGSYGFHAFRIMRTANIPRHYLNLSTLAHGTGLMFASETIKDGWQWLLITEDIEFSIDQILADYPIAYCHDAIFYDEQPTKAKVMFRQRIRWSKDFLMVFGSRGWELFKHIFTKKAYKNVKRFTFYDMLFHIFPMGLVLLFWRIMYVIASAIAVYMMGGNTNAFLLNYGKNFLLSYGFIYISFLLNTLPSLILEWKRFPAPSYKKILYFFAFPFFDIITPIILVIALFSKPEWKPIKHTDSRDIESINKYHID